ncbi:MAG: helix-turn-helix domain-containing protein [Brevundimonas sp.]
MALDAGQVPDEFKAHPDWKDIAPSIAESATLGDGLRRAREVSGKSLAELSAETKVHVRFLTALEQNDWSSLPSRVFAIGYVRGYAAALGLDEQLAVERFKRDSPDNSAPLKAPIGIAFEDVKRYSPRIIAVVAVAALAIVGWNVFQRINLMKAPRASDIAAVPESWTLGDVPGQNGLIDLSAPQAAPPDQTTPALYITPGLETQLTGIDPNDPAVIAATAAANNAPVQKAFNPRGAVYGAPATASQVVIQAKKAGALVVRLGDGQALFARQMAAGEAWRAPTGVSATIDVSDPAAFDVYLNGEHGGILPAVLTPLAQLNSRAEQAARQVAEDQARRVAQAQAERAAQQAVQASVPATAATTN